MQRSAPRRMRTDSRQRSQDRPCGGAVDTGVPGDITKVHQRHFSSLSTVTISGFYWYLRGWRIGTDLCMCLKVLECKCTQRRCHKICFARPWSSPITLMIFMASALGTFSQAAKIARPPTRRTRWNCCKCRARDNSHRCNPGMIHHAWRLLPIRIAIPEESEGFNYLPMPHPRLHLNQCLCVRLRLIFRYSILSSTVSFSISG